MKQYIKRVVLALCLAACFLTLSACASADTGNQETLDPQLAAYITQTSESLTASIAALGEEDGAQTEELLTKQKENGLAGGVSSWLNVLADTGKFVDIISSEASITEDGLYVGTVETNCEKRQVEFKFFYGSEDGQQLNTVESVSISPDYTVGERMEKAGLNTVMGLVVVFIMLIFISLLIYCFKFINPAAGKKVPAEESHAAPLPAVSAGSAEDEEIAAVIAAAIAAAEDDELAAVLTAAVASYENENSSSDQLVARSIRHARRTKRRW